MPTSLLHNGLFFRWICFGLIAISINVWAKPLPEDPLQRRCWLQYTAERTEPDA